VTDPVHHLVHDHAELNARVLELGARVRTLGHDEETGALGSSLRELRERLFLHFAREEEGLFPFVADALGELTERVNAMAVAHDTICGALARMCHLASSNASRSALTPLFERFETAYAEHAQAEAALLADLDGRLDADHRRLLSELVAGV